MQMLTCIFHLLVSYTAQLRADQLEGMIVGGEYANITHHPHSVFLDIDCEIDGKKLGWVCGASIVNQNIILTAGHCIYQCDSSALILARVGSDVKYQGGIYKVYSFIIHEDYAARTSSNDIGLLKTEQAIQFDHKVSRVALMRQPPYSESAMVAGWGLTDEERKISSTKLKFLTQMVWSHSDCVKVLKNMQKGNICAAANRTTEFAAQGDSGSALVVRGYIQIGIVSFKLPKLANYVIVYTDVGYYYDWIKYNSKTLYCIRK